MQTHSHSADDEIVSSEACKILQVDRATLLRWVSDGQVAATRKLPGRTGAFLFRRGDIQQLANKRAADKAEATA
ncbi:helix-turn-helix domain-containing protein [Mycolicibacterium vanbaalenii]|uniref:helix-turn-helix domain-containing protein n=1 Tax=Mycolicibacterium vanbaalenii TaxID=110539 RepID=UPI001F308753|nr:helix-turn-helix domain-containing protein [Mycolicibacterium vanbaalenii]UJL29975.1 helix-turn-helix domain-containing protein [Mycolicibacterium vanbaalenii]WND56962.1 helix-turn-helix domain-containing protein [Mycolicibacterium vanbaalenii]